MRIDIETMRRTLGKPLARRVGLAAGVVVAGAVGLLALPSRSGNVPLPDTAACCTGAVTVGDTMMSPATGADKDFFEVPSSPANVVFMMGNNESMLDYPQWLPEVVTNDELGCSDPALVTAMNWFDITSTDPAKNGSIPFDADSDFASGTATPTAIHFFDPNRFYMSRGRRPGWQSKEYPFSLSDDTRRMEGEPTAAMACYRAYKYKDIYKGTPDYEECKTCLTTKGWWRGPLEVPPYVSWPNPSQAWYDPPYPPEARRTWVLSGRVLNVRPPKFVVARKVLKDVIQSTTDVRMGVASFGPDKGWYDPPMMLEKLRPTCDKSFPTINLDALDRPLLQKAVNKVHFGHNERSIGESLFGIGGYFSSQLVDNRWRTWFLNPISPPYGWPGGPSGGTVTNPYNSAQPGTPWANSADEWLKVEQPWEGTGQYDKSVCFSCQVNSVIVLTDGEPKFDNSVPITKMMQILLASGAKHPDGTPLTFDPSSPDSNPSPGGVNYCDRFEKSPGVKATKTDCDYTYYNWPTGHAKTNKNFMDDVSFFLANADLRGDLAGNQSVRTYTIGYGDNSAMLQSIALAGKGAFYRVNNPGELRDAIKAVLGDMRQVSTSFATANISTVQTGGAQSSVYVPRFVPRKNRPYEGHLYRFFFYNEFAQGCDDTKAKSTAGDPRDLNSDKDCDDSFFLDKPAGFVVAPGAVPSISSFTKSNIVQENVDGVWVKVATAKVNTDGTVEGGTPAEPFWNLGETLGARKAKDACNRSNPLDPASGRCIFTMVDRDKDGKFTSTDNPPVEFITDNLADLKQHILGAGDTFCVQLFSRQKKAWTGAAAEQDECARDVIRFIRGMDVLDFDNDGIRDEERPCADNKLPTDTKSCKLADIFHSTPVTVEPPIEPFLCTLGLHPQCASTLYDDFSNSVTSQTLCSSGGAPCYMATPMDPKRGSTGYKYGSYDVFRETYSKRERIALVGSNGGMLHALHVGSATSRTKDGVLDDIHDLGSGQELWSFIPPDLLPKLGLVFLMHQYFVDGTPMVRDVWADGAVSGTRNGIKEANEFRTLAIITERSGGQRFTALDVTDPREMLKADGKPFRWMFPNACAPESATMGQSWSNYSPKPPPIGPVRLKPTVTTDSSTKRGWEERWVAMINGGHSPDLSRGRGVYMVDVWSGAPLWAAEARPGLAAGDTYQALLNQMMPVVASPALVDIGKAETVQRDLDGFFDTMVVGDVGGQVWTFRFFEPGELDATTGMVKNWFGARSLEMARNDASVDGPSNLYQKAPITNIASNVLQPETGWLRSFVGTGDRQHLRTAVGSDCGPDDLLACVRMKCSLKATFAADINGVQRTSTIEYVNGALVTNSDTWNGTSAAVCQASRLDITALSIDCPEATTIGTGTYTLSTVSTQSSCEVAGGLWSCKQSQLSTGTRSSLTLNDADKAEVTKNRYFAFHSYGGWQRKFDDVTSALKFDTKRLTDTQNFSCGTDSSGAPMKCSLVDVTIPDATYAEYTRPDGTKVRYVPSAKMGTLKRGTTEGPGWFVKYNSIQERTAAGSAVLAGIVFWPSFSPAASSGTSACALSGAGDISNMWQADAITGLPDQADGFRLYNDKGEMLGFSSFKGRPTSAPPTDPPPLISMSKTGGIRYEVAVTSPGEAPRTEKLRTQSNVTPDIYWLEVPRNLHECRHQNAQACD